MLLELGKIYGYETSAAINDAKKKFMGRSLEEIATVRDFPKFLSYPKVVKVASYIDVMWFSGDTDALVPEFAFEVEHTTEVTENIKTIVTICSVYDRSFDN